MPVESSLSFQSSCHAAPVARGVLVWAGAEPSAGDIPVLTQRKQLTVALAMGAGKGSRGSLRWGVREGALRPFLHWGGWNGRSPNVTADSQLPLGAFVCLQPQNLLPSKSS